MYYGYYPYPPVYAYAPAYYPYRPFVPYYVVRPPYFIP
jgi:hypothetical protein